MDPEVKVEEVAPEVAPAEPAVVEPAVETPAESTPELIELADGRKVTGTELRTLYQDELLPEFTRRSQELAKLQNQKPPTETPKETWIPQSYDEILEKAEQRVFEKMTARQQQEQEARQQLATTIDSTLGELKTLDPALNESQLFQHATKYGFGDLKVAYQNMKDMNLIAESTEQRVARDLARRAGTPIAGTPQSGTASAEGIEYNPFGQKETPQEALRRLNQH